MSVHVIISRQNEDLAWIPQAFKDLHDTTFYIYNKGVNNNICSELLNPAKHIHHIRLPNVGCESDTYLHHFITHYELYKTSPYPIYILCTQGKSNTKRHVEQLLQDAKQHRLSKSNAIAHEIGPHRATYDFSLPRWGPVPIQPYGETFGKWFETYVSKPFPSDPILWWVNAMFAFDSSLLRNKPLKYYMALKDTVCHSPHPEANHFMERAWLYILTASYEYMAPPASTPKATSNKVINDTRPKILTVTSPNYKEMFDIYYASLKPVDNGFNLIVLELDLSSYKEFGFQKDSWYFVLHRKIQFVVEELEKCTPGEYVIVSDADIQFFKPLQLFELIEEAKRRDIDWFGMPEGKRRTYNGGFYILRVSQRIIAFFKDIDRRMSLRRYAYGDQTLINEMLPRSGIKNNQIPLRYVVWGPERMTQEAIFHHAVCTTTCSDKLKQIAHQRNVYDKLINNTT